MIGHHTIGRLQTRTRREKRALAHVTATSSRALVMISGGKRPATVRDGLRPGIPVSGPAAVGPAGRERAVELHRIRAQVQRLFNERDLRVVARAAAHQGVEARRTDIAATTLGESKAEIECSGALQVGQVAIEQLFLQRHGGGGDHQLAAQRLRDGDGRHHVCYGFSGSGPGLDDTDGAASSLILPVPRERIGDVRDHGALTRARLQSAGREPAAVGTLYRLFDLVVQQGCGLSGSVFGATISGGGHGSGARQRTGVNRVRAARRN